jgi:hypothetical protein
MPLRYIGEWKYNSTFLDLGTNMAVSGQLHASVLPSGKDPRTHWLRGWVGPRGGLDVVEKRKSYTVGNRNRAIQPIALRYTDWAIPTPYTQTWFSVFIFFGRCAVENNENLHGSGRLGLGFLYWQQTVLGRSQIKCCCLYSAANSLWYLVIGTRWQPAESVFCKCGFL